MKNSFLYFTLLVLFKIGLFAEQEDSATLLEQYESVFSNLPNWEKKSAKIQAFGEGCTNQNYLLTIHQERYFIRVGSQSRKFLGLSFKKEHSLIQLAATLNLAPPILTADLFKEVIVMPFIESKPVDLHQKGYLVETLKLLKKLHASNRNLLFSATPEEIISFYLAKIEELKIQLSPLQQVIINKRPRLSPVPLVPCHLDLKSQNVLDDGVRLWIIDWEYGAMSEPLFDLASLASADSFTDEEMDKLLVLYAGSPSAEMKERLKQLRILADLRWALWALIQMHTSTLNLPYQQWVEELFYEVETRIKSFQPPASYAAGSWRGPTRQYLNAPSQAHEA